MKKILLVFGLAVSLSACNKEREDTANPLPLVIKQPNSLIKTIYVCPNCLEWGCIYEDIDTAIEGGGTDTDIYNAVMYVIKERGINDSATIKLLLANYYL